MCGLVAIVSFTSTVPLDALRAGASALTHRGPDGATTWISDSGRAGLGHTRLGLIDPGAVQPIACEDDRLRLIANGEFYDHDRLRAELRSRGHHFRTGTDSEIALHLYQERGARCLDDLRGEFAFIVWDDREQELFAARDRFGVKPLFTAWQDDTLFLASEIKALFALGVRRAWDHHSTYQGMHGCFPPDRTLFSGVRQIPAGHVLRVSRARQSVEQYWDIDFPRRSTMGVVVDEAEVARDVRRHLDDAVRLRMRADVPVGYLLSGGLDSSAMIGIAASHDSTPRQAFTVAFDSDRYDESSAAHRTAAHLGADLCVVQAGDAELADCFTDAVVAGEALVFNAHAPARFLLSRTINHHGYRAVMGGEGADEAFAGYGFVRSATNVAPTRWLGLAGKALTMLLPLHGQERSLGRTSQLLARATRIVAVPPWLVARGAEWLDAQRSVLDPDFRDDFRHRDPFLGLLREIDLRGQVVGRERARQILYVWLRSIFVGYHLGADRLDMAHSVETRVPYLDHHLFERVSQIPIATLARGNHQKHLLREAARPFVTDAVHAGRKQPFYAPPLASEPGTATHQLVRDLVSSPGCRDVPFLDQAGCTALLDRLPTLDAPDRATLDPILMLVASLIALQAHYRPT